MNVGELINQFVVIIDPVGGAFRRIESAPWIDTLEARLPKRLPTSYRSLVTRFVSRRLILVSNISSRTEASTQTKS
jgi:hypothetical protein